VPAWVVAGAAFAAELAGTFWPAAVAVGAVAWDALAASFVAEPPALVVVPAEVVWLGALLLLAEGAVDTVDAPASAVVVEAVVAGAVLG